ncbi:bifunctional nuclease family protein [Cryptosporangium aurantiacum]|uniref:bifunctional nuclease family protein n=1 Tax=Cryptosporangium aurantiacum TaxID=134849 RepID=UPI0015BDF740|nr:bifunctional nuclease domain-containing protein [Cryptosporangium aurantiacum]
MTTTPGGGQEDQRIVVLREADGDRRLELLLEHYEAAPLAGVMGGENSGFPPYALLLDLLRTMRLPVEKAVIDTGRNSDGGGDLRARPSDAITPALRTDTPIYASAELLDRTGATLQ